MWQAFQDTKSGNSEIVFVLDEDDPTLDSYRAITADPVAYIVVPASRRGMVGALNYAYRDFESSGRLGFAVGFMGDDHRPRTSDWDGAYLRALRDLNTGFVYGNDLLQGELMPTQVAMTSDIPRALGFMSPPVLDHLCVDLVWLELGKAVGAITYLPDVIIEHMHPLAGKAKEDKNYKAVNSNMIARHDSRAYTDYMHTDFLVDVAKLRMLQENGYTEPWDE